MSGHSSMPRNLRMRPVHPGVYILDELKARQVTPATLAHDIGVSAAFVYDVLAGRRNISPAMAMRLGSIFGTSPLLWLRLQEQWDAAAEL